MLIGFGLVLGLVLLFNLPHVINASSYAWFTAKHYLNRTLSKDPAYLLDKCIFDAEQKQAKIDESCSKVLAMRNTLNRKLEGAKIRLKELNKLINKAPDMESARPYAVEHLALTESVKAYEVQIENINVMADNFMAEKAKHGNIIQNAGHQILLLKSRLDISEMNKQLIDLQKTCNMDYSTNSKPVEQLELLIDKNLADVEVATAKMSAPNNVIDQYLLTLKK